MRDPLKQAGKNMGREINRACENLSDGWREWRSRSKEACAHFSRRKCEARYKNGAPTVRRPKPGRGKLGSLQVSRVMPCL